MCQIPEFEYPLAWRFQIITAASPDALPELISVLRARGFSQMPEASHASRTGKYQTYILNITLDDHESRLDLTRALTDARCVKYLL